MKAAYLMIKASPDALIVGEVPRPDPKPDEVLVQVYAAAVTPSELLWYPTFSTRSGVAREFPIILGHEFSGVIAALGADVQGFKIGDAVYGMNDWFVNGAQAEYCLAPASFIALKPRTIGHAEASTVPISALTAWQAIKIKSNLRRGQRILIHGGAGGVGLFAVQLAHAWGAEVIATASGVDRELLRGLGADTVIDYRTTRFEDVVRDVDVVLDTQGGETLQRSWQVLKPGGSMVTIAAVSEHETEQRVRDAFLLVEPHAVQLSAIGREIDAVRLRVLVAGEFSLISARAAFATPRKSGPGKNVIVLAPDQEPKSEKHFP
jgi:NADPH:quinone reductase-like Zn-dependent oxidoreductase